MHFPGVQIAAMIPNTLGICEDCILKAYEIGSICRKVHKAQIS